MAHFTVLGQSALVCCIMCTACQQHVRCQSIRQQDVHQAVQGRVSFALTGSSRQASANRTRVELLGGAEAAAQAASAKLAEDRDQSQREVNTR